jgi:hypothetical protein
MYGFAISLYNTTRWIFLNNGGGIGAHRVTENGAHRITEDNKHLIIE